MTFPLAMTRRWIWTIAVEYAEKNLGEKLTGLLLLCAVSFRAG
jgi:hypothetical protein